MIRRRLFTTKEQNFRVVSQTIPPQPRQDIHIQILSMCEYATLHGKGGLRLQVDLGF